MGKRDLKFVATEESRPKLRYLLALRNGVRRNEANSNWGALHKSSGFEEPRSDVVKPRTSGTQAAH